MMSKNIDQLQLEMDIENIDFGIAHAKDQSVITRVIENRWDPGNLLFCPKMLQYFAHTPLIL
jgi:hypothetical protein